MLPLVDIIRRILNHTLFSRMNFRKSFLAIALFLPSVFLMAQSAITKVFATGVCHCFDSLNRKAPSIENVSTCFSSGLEKNDTLIYHEVIRVYGDVQTAHINKFEEDLEETTHLFMIDSCTTYFKLIDSLRFVQLNNLNKDSLRGLLRKAGNIEESKKTKGYREYIGQLYFQLGIFDTAETIEENLLRGDSLNIRSLHIMGLINEIKGNYRDAALLYDRLAALTNKNNYLTFSAIARRKERELHR